MRFKKIISTASAGVIVAAALCLTPVRAQDAGTLTLTVGITYGNGFDVDNRPPISHTLTALGQGRYEGNISVTNGGNTWISFPNVPTGGVCYVIDTSPTNTVGALRISSDGTNFVFRCRPGMPTVGELDNNMLVLTVTSNAVHTALVGVYCSDKNH